MAHVKFRSLAHPDHAYAVDTMAYEGRNDAQVDVKYRMFETYGDGLTQHSSDWPITLEFVTDFLFSLAVAMQENEELLQLVAYDFTRKPTDKEIEFAANLKFKPADEKHSNRRWYSIKELKVSASEAKRHDRRYEEVPDWADGTAKAIFRLVLPEYANGLDRFAYAEAIHEWLLAHDGWMELSASFLGWFKDDERHDQHDRARELRNAYDTCRSLVLAYQMKHAGQVGIENYQRKLERAAQKKTEQTA